MQYQIRIQGQIDPTLAGWFGEFDIMHTADGDTLLTGTIVDQAALHGVFARCRDLGVTLISVNPQREMDNQEERNMKPVIVEASDVINARPEDVYAVISDYHVGHQAIIPRQYFKGMVVEKGGKGAGTVIRLQMSIYGQKYSYHQIVSEPEPGRVLVETDLDTGQFSKFIVEPVNGGKQTKVTIYSEFPGKPGFAGFMERLMQPGIVRGIYKKELRQLADYVGKR